MSDSTTKFATAARFTSVAIVSFVLCTGGFWVYQNREELVNNLKEARKEGSVSEWVVRAAGGNPEDVRNPFHVQAKPMTDYMKPLEFNTELMKDLHKGFLYNPDN
jgi:hypothetical protein